MRKLIVPIALSALVAAVPAWAAKPTHPTHQTHPAHPSQGNGNACSKPREEGYNARGTLVSGTLSAGTKPGHYNGTLTVTVTRANHKAATASQTYTLMDARVHLGRGVSATALAAGDRVKLHGKITVLPHKCSSSTFTPTITVHDVTIKAAS